MNVRSALNANGAGGSFKGVFRPCAKLEAEIRGVEGAVDHCLTLTKILKLTRG